MALAGPVKTPAKPRPSEPTSTVAKVGPTLTLGTKTSFVGGGLPGGWLEGGDRALRGASSKLQ